VVDRINRIGREVALEFDIPTPTFCVYQDEKFDVMVVGIGNMATVFLSEPVSCFGDLELKAILAHEYGHIRLKHSMVRLSLYGSLLALAIIGSGTPMLAILANIFVLWTMRQMEFAADHVAVLAVGVDNFKSTLMLVGCSFGDVPSWQIYFSTHPSFRQRVERLV
jgi:Zn-dependent protease with chaperone function